MTTTSKTLLITQDFAPLTGGVANYYLNRVENKQSGEIVVLMNKVSGFESVKTKNKVYFKNFFTKIIWPHWLPLIFQAQKIIKKEKSDVIWIGQVLPVGTVVWLLSKIFHYKYFVTCHGNDLLRAKSHPRKFKLVQRILNTAEYIEANTKFTQQILISDYKISADKIKIVYPQNILSQNQIDKQAVEKIKDKFNLQDKKILLTVARLVASKNTKNIIKALPQVIEAVPDLKYIIIGEGQERSALEKLVKELELEKNVIFIGQVEHSILPNYYGLADCFVLTPYNKQGSDVESFGIVYLEAQEFDLPIIASDVGGVKEAMGNYKKVDYVKSEDVKKIAEKIIQQIK